MVRDYFANPLDTLPCIRMHISHPSSIVCPGAAMPILAPTAGFRQGNQWWLPAPISEWLEYGRLKHPPEWLGAVLAVWQLQQVLVIPRRQGVRSCRKHVAGISAMRLCNWNPWKHWVFRRISMYLMYFNVFHLYPLTFFKYLQMKRGPAVVETHRAVLFVCTRRGLREAAGARRGRRGSTGAPNGSGASCIDFSKVSWFIYFLGT